MQQPFTIKGIRIGEGRPVICVPVVAAEKTAVIQKIKELAEKQAQMIEWRVDCFDGIGDPAQVAEVLEEIRPFVSQTVLLFTIRTAKQGGNALLPEKSITYLNELAAKSGCVDMVDLEFFEATKPEKSIRRLQSMGVRVIASHHDFHTTPDDRILRMVMDQMRQGGADVAKLAVMPQSASDVLRVLTLTADLKQSYPDLPVVTMSMGARGVVSRVVGEAFGSCITFGADGAVSAPGQLPMNALADVLDILHAGMMGGM